MAWTKEKPKIGGYYWVKANIAGRVHTLPVFVYRTSRNIKHPNTVSSEGEIYNINDSLFKEWWNEQIIIQTEEEYFRAFILKNWNRDKIIRFAKHLLGDECQNNLHCPKT